MLSIRGRGNRSIDIRPLQLAIVQSSPQLQLVLKMTGNSNEIIRENAALLIASLETNERGVLM
jgi:hypothetical protein